MKQFLVLLFFVLACFLSCRTASAQSKPSVTSAPARRVAAPYSKRTTSASAGENAVKQSTVTIPSFELPCTLVKLTDLALSPGEQRRINDNGLVKGHRFVVVYPTEEIVKLLFRRSPADSVWQQIGLQLPRYAVGDTRNKINWRENLVGVLMDTCDMNQQGASEILLTIVGETHGAGTGAVREEVTAINVLSVDAKPRLLLAALSVKTYGSDSNSEGTGQPFTYGWRRSFKLRRELHIGKAERLGGGSSSFGITPLKPGWYQYRAGHLVWVRY